MDVNKIKEEVRLIAQDLQDDNILAVGIFGSLARGDFNERSDIDIFIITSKEISLKRQDELYFAFSRLIGRFEKDVSVLVYDIETLKKVPSWQTLNLVKDASFVQDVGGVESIFKRILDAAGERGIVYDDKEKVFRLEKPARTIFSLME